MLKNILENVLSSGSNGADDKIKQLIKILLVRIKFHRLSVIY